MSTTATVPTDTATDLAIPAPRRAEPSTPRVWLVAGLGTGTEPSDHPVVRDDLMRRWLPDSDTGGYVTADGRHHATWTELHARYDLVEVTS